MMFYFSNFLVKLVTNFGVIRLINRREELLEIW